METGQITKKEKIKSRRQKERENRRNEITGAAERLVMIHGLKIITMEKVAEEAALGKGTLYNYFDTKEELILAVATRSFQELTRRYLSAIEDNPELLGKIKGLLRSYDTLVGEYPGLKDILPRGEADRFLNPIIKKVGKGGISELTRNEREFLSSTQENYNTLVKLVEAAVENDLVSINQKPALVAMYMSILTGNILEELKSRRNILKRLDTTEEEAFDGLIDMLANGFLKK